MHWFIGIVIVIEAYYWLVYFPRAWKDGSNEEIRVMRENVRFMRKPGMPWGQPKD